MAFNNLFSSPRLVYTSLEIDDEKAQAFLAKALRNDPIAYGQGLDILLEPPTSQMISNTLNSEANSLLGVMTGLPSLDPSAELIPIGHLSLSACNRKRHHRSCTLAIMIYAPHQGKGYGTEAINWALDWAFKIAGMHSVRLWCWLFNDRALRLYERLGFVREGVFREDYYVDFKWHDTILFSMLEKEYIEMRKKIS